eukprot:1723671-Prymnesium_polylepis.1
MVNNDSGHSPTSRTGFRDIGRQRSSGRQQRTWLANIRTVRGRRADTERFGACVLETRTGS